MSGYNPMPLDHSTRETFIRQMVEDMAVEGYSFEEIAETENLHYEELWQLSWELEAYYVHYTRGYVTGQQ